jgi:hypothetical protein
LAPVRPGGDRDPADDGARALGRDPRAYATPGTRFQRHSSRPPGYGLVKTEWTAVLAAWSCVSAGRDPVCRGVRRVFEADHPEDAGAAVGRILIVANRAAQPHLFDASNPRWPTSSRERRGRSGGGA